MRTEAYVNVVNFAKVAALNKLTNFIYSGVKTVNNADIENLAGFVLSLLHFKSFCIGSCSGLFAQNVLACVECVDSYLGVLSVGSADRNCFDFRVSKNFFVIQNSFTAAVFSYASFCFVKQNITEINYLCFGVVHIRRDVCAVCDSTATDNCYFHYKCFLRFYIVVTDGFYHKM